MSAKPTKKTGQLLLSRLRLWLDERDVAAYLVGGYVRDLMLGRDTRDIDIAVDADCVVVAADLAKDLGGKHVVIDQMERVARVLVSYGGPGCWNVDISTLQGPIEADLARRDFTIDAMALDMRLWDEATSVESRLIDPLSGKADLARRLVRAAGQDIFFHDAGRLLRAVRLAAELEFCIEPATTLLIQQLNHLVDGVAPERLQDELCRTLAAPRVGQSLRLLDDLGLLERLFPELGPCRGVTQPKEHHWDVFNHLLETAAAVEHLANSLDSDLERWASMLREHLGQEVASGHSRLVLLKLGGLLHDIAKPQTKMLDDTGRTRFFGHGQQGAELVSGTMQRLRFSARERQLLEKMVAHHLRPTQMASEGVPTSRAIYRYFRDLGDAAIDTLLLSLADHLAARGPDLDPEQWRQHVNVVNYVLEQHLASPPRHVGVKLVDGHDLMAIFGLEPGPEFGPLLEAVREAQGAGEITSREEALALLKRLISESAAREGEQK